MGIIKSKKRKKKIKHETKGLFRYNLDKADNAMRLKGADLLIFKNDKGNIKSVDIITEYKGLHESYNFKIRKGKSFKYIDSLSRYMAREGYKFITWGKAI